MNEDNIDRTFPGSQKPPLFLLAGLAALGEFAATAYLPALTIIAGSLGASIEAIQGTVTAGLVTFALGGLLIGAAADGMGRRNLLLPALLLYMIGCLLAAMAPSVFWLYVGRICQALGAGAGLIASRAIARDLRSGAELTRLLSAVTLTFSLAPAVAPLLGGFMVEWLGWRGIFVCAFLYGFILFVAVWRMPETNRTPLARANGSAIFSRYSGILQNPGFIFPSLTAAALLGALFAFLVGAAPIFVDQLQLNPALVGCFPALTMSGLILGTILAGSRALRLGPASLIRLGSLIAVIGACAMTIVPVSAPYILATLIVFNFGLGLVLPVATSMAMSQFGDRAGAASALIGFVHLGGGAAGSIIVPLINAPIAQAVPITMTMAAVAAFLMSLLLRVPRQVAAVNQ